MIMIRQVTLGFYPGGSKKSFRAPENLVTYDPDRHAFCIDGTWHDQAGAVWIEDGPQPPPCPPGTFPPNPEAPAVTEEPDGGHQPSEAGGPASRPRSRKR
jgi:hypothetical protein